MEKCDALGVFYEMGYGGLDVDDGKAREFYEKACHEQVSEGKDSELSEPCIHLKHLK
jgi:TPR repeat protein